jgi:spore maturation protein CgeB
MKFVLFYHSFVSCWNHGNAHFLRGVLRELVGRGHAVQAFEPADGWSRLNLLREQHGPEALADFARHFPELRPRLYGPDLDLEAALDGTDVVIVHEWTDPVLIAAIGDLRRRGGRFLLLFHDTHHRAVSNPQMVSWFDPESYDGGLVFGEVLAEIYRRRGWEGRVHVWHEAADTAVFRPPAAEGERAGLVWIGNWGDAERSAELDHYLLGPVARLGLGLDVHGVRYPPEALDRLAVAGAACRGWLPNRRVPEVFARHLATVHVPRRYYAQLLPGIPTIRVFEALACGIPLLSAPWSDCEGLFRPGEDFVLVRSGDEMRRRMKALVADRDWRAELAAKGRATIRARHSCAHRAAELLQIIEMLRPTVRERVA